MLNSLSALSFHSLLEAVSRVVHDFFSCSNIARLLALLLWSSKHKWSKPILWRRLYTTFNAAIFSATNKTFLPLAKLWQIIFAMVSDLPVPGGPSKTKSWAFVEASIATNWELSAFKGAKTSEGFSVLSISFWSLNWTSCSYVFWGCSIKCSTKGLDFRSLTLSFKSFHIKYLANENVLKVSSSTTSNPLISFILSLTTDQIKSTSIPLSSVGSTSLNWDKSTS